MSLTDEFKEITNWKYRTTLPLYNFRCQTWTDWRAGVLLQCTVTGSGDTCTKRKTDESYLGLAF